MSKKKKKHRSKFERSIDHRNEGFDARDAMYEQVRDTAKTINRQIITKKGLNDYTEEEIMAKAGEITTYNYNNRYTWEEFKAMPTVNQREYICHLRQKYKGIRATDIADMFGVTRTAISGIANTLKLSFPRGGSYTSEGRARFAEEMLGDAPPVVQEAPEPIQEEAAEPNYRVEKVSLVTSADEVTNALKAMGFYGKVYITAEVIFV